MADSMAALKRQEGGRNLNSSARSSKKAKSLDPLEDEKYKSVVPILVKLRKQWNDLSKTREKQAALLYDMDRIVKGSRNYSAKKKRPDDDDDGFMGEFSRLTNSEQAALRAIAIQCRKDYKPITDSDLKALLRETCKPKAPYFVFLGRRNKDGETNKEDFAAGFGTERFPFRNSKEAVNALEDQEGFVHLKIKCLPSCTKGRCQFDACERIICKEHGDGNAGRPPSGRKIIFPEGACMVCKQFFYCEEHADRMGRCDVCHFDGYSYHSMVGDYGQDDDDDEGSDPDEVGPTPGNSICDNCVVVCTKPASEDYPDEGECGFRCCPDHVDDHECGNDPTEYM